MTDASRNVTRGHVTVTAEDVASALDVTDEAIEAIFKAMQGRVLDGDRLSGWEKRQPKREDVGSPETGVRSSAERKKAQRERERKSRNVTQCHDESRNVTLDKDKDKDKDKDTEEAKATAKASNIPSSDHSMKPELLQDSGCLRTNCEKSSQSARTKIETEKISSPEKTKPAPAKPKPETTRAVNPLLLKPDDVSERAWCDFVTLRRAKRAPITEGVIKTFRAEARKAGISLEEAINTAVYQGWQGFRADWFANANRSNSRRNDPEDIYAYNMRVSGEWLAKQQRKPAPLIVGEAVVDDPLAQALKRRVLPAALTPAVFTAPPFGNGDHHA